MLFVGAISGSGEEDEEREEDMATSRQNAQVAVRVLQNLIAKFGRGCLARASEPNNASAITAELSPTLCSGFQLWFNCTPLRLLTTYLRTNLELWQNIPLTRFASARSLNVSPSELLTMADAVPTHEKSIIRQLAGATQPVLTRIAHGSAPFLTVFALIHLTAPAMANVGGTSLASQVMVRGRLMTGRSLSDRHRSVAGPRVLSDSFWGEVPCPCAARNPPPLRHPEAHSRPEACPPYHQYIEHHWLFGGCHRRAALFHPPHSSFGPLSPYLLRGPRGARLRVCQVRAARMAVAKLRRLHRIHRWSRMARRRGHVHHLEYLAAPDAWRTSPDSQDAHHWRPGGRPPRGDGTVLHVEGTSHGLRVARR